jgi:hypothetical protein
MQARFCLIAVDEQTFQLTTKRLDRQTVAVSLHLLHSCEGVEDCGLS